ncbi:MAG TPA: hypothetical protein VNE21_09630, partial [Mycobacteriales bacterium]|nr:hypothetical protein [Mycobacteriales bacterium]
MRNSGLRTGQGRRRARREHRRVGRWAFVAVAAAAMCGVGASVGAAAEPATAPTGGSAAASMPVPFNEQAYTTDTPDNPQTSEPIDPYNGDPSSIHIAVNSGSELARSFVHIALDYLPPGTTATGVTATFHLTAQSDASNTGTYPTYNVQTSSAIVEACALSTPLASPFDPAKPPPYDCEHGSAIGKPNAAGDTWTFNLKDLLAYWHTHGNTGAALLPIVASPSSTWGVAFYVSRSSAVVSYVSTPAAAVVPPVTATSTPAVRASTAAPVPQVTPAAVAQAPPVAGPTAGPPAAPAPAASATMTVAPTVAAPQVATSVAPATSSGRTGGSGGGVRSYWPWVLIGCLVLVAGSLGIAHRGALAAYARRVGPAGLAMYRVHPRAYTVASVAAAWGLVFSGYSLVVHPAAPGSGSTLASGPANGATSNSAGGASGGTQPGTQGVGHAKTHVVRLANGTLAVVPVAGPTSGSTSTPTVTNPQASEFSGAGTYRVINGVEVFFPANGGPPVADLYHGADDTIGISATTINLCAHAALTYGAAFNISASDLHVYWAWRNAHGGLYGRKVNDTYQNDNYDPGTAVQAAQACKDANTFM